MSSNDSAAPAEPPLKKVKVEHTSERPSVRERAEVMVDEAATGDDEAILAARSAGAITQDNAARAPPFSISRLSQDVDRTGSNT